MALKDLVLALRCAIGWGGVLNTKLFRLRKPGITEAKKERQGHKQRAQASHECICSWPSEYVEAECRRGEIFEINTSGEHWHSSPAGGAIE